MAPFEILALAASIVGTSAAFPAPFKGANQQVIQGHDDQSTLQKTPGRPYRCLGTDLSNHPLEHTWLPFDQLWDINRDSILHANNGDTYAQHYIHESILKVAIESDLDPRWILVVLMQDSQGDITSDCLVYGPGCSTTTSPANSGRVYSRESILTALRQAVRGIRGSIASPESKTLAPGSVSRTDYLADLANRLIGWDGSGPGAQGCVAGG